MRMKPRESGQTGQAVYSIRWAKTKKRIKRIAEYALILFAVVFCMAAGIACFRQYELLPLRWEVQPRQQGGARKVGAVSATEKAQSLVWASRTEPEVHIITPEESAEDLELEQYYDSLELLACCVEAEAGNQGLTGKRLVVDVVLNRVDDRDFPNTIWDVITQPYHFTSYWDGAMDRAEPTEETFEAVRMELEQRSYPGIYYFASGGWPEYGTPWRQVGDHYFSGK